MDGSTRPGAVTARVSKILSSNYRDTEAAIATLNTLSEYDLVKELEHGFGRENGSINAGVINLRRKVDSQLGAGAKAFLEAFENVNENLDQLQTHLNEMHVCCNDIGEKLAAANSGTRYLIEHAEGLRQQRSATTIKQSVIVAFLARFTLTPSELQTLTSPSIPVGPAMFAAMDKIERIRSDCQVLLAVHTETDGQTEDSDERMRAGLDIMQNTSSQLDQAYSKLYKWAAFQIRGYTKPEVDVSSAMRQVVHRLKEREDFMKELLDLLATTRSTSVLGHFTEALTRGGPSGLPRPIELHAHDPIRYVGDMLAWVHQAMAGEREFLESFFGVKDDGRLPGAVRPIIRQKQPEEKIEDENYIQRLMDKDLEGCGRPLRLRIQQTVRSQEGSLMALKIRNLVAFYNLTIERTIGKDALMSKVLTEIASAATDAFYATLDAAGRSYLRFIQAPPQDLSPPLMLRDALTTLRDIMDIYDTSLMDHSDDVQTQLPFDEIFARALDPPLEMCQQMADMRPSEWDRHIYMLNCLGLTKTTLEPYMAFSQSRIDSLTLTMEQRSDKLVDEHYQSILKESGLAPILQTFESRTGETPLASIPAASPSALSASLRTFDAFLATSLLSTSPRLAYLTYSRLAENIHSLALVKLSQAYTNLYDAVMSGKEGYEFGVTRMRRTPVEVNTLLGVD